MRESPNYSKFFPNWSNMTSCLAPCMGFVMSHGFVKKKYNAVSKKWTLLDAKSRFMAICSL